MASVFTGWFQVTNDSNSEGLSLHNLLLIDLQLYTHEFKQLTNLFFENSNVFFQTFGALSPSSLMSEMYCYVLVKINVLSK